MRPAVLLVEDDEDTSFTLESLLELEKINCKSARSRDEALKILNDGYTPACVLMDYMMPGMSLSEFVKKTDAEKLKMILVTAHTDINRIAKRFGVRHIVRKPIDLDELLRAIKSCVDGKERA